jgi:hypothetical protein
VQGQIGDAPAQPDENEARITPSDGNREVIRSPVGSRYRSVRPNLAYLRLGDNHEVDAFW